ncbi:CHAP domain-containing protein [Kibdelosporangium aridum]|uniref:CHAP domain-containing protein n=1 Tax=Kibdelosporangium aridum TaxID=2030 RepID=A0A428ZE62_KIBAR|nr:CHAP domain-containing protein [Kibdelosporangium aridum]RSM86336.1 CHAP domain-containing protein [Kibdelosporangium aridum]
MNGWLKNRYIRAALSASALAVGFSFLAPAGIALAASTHQGSSQSSVSAKKKQTDARAKQKTTPGRAAPSNPAPAPKPKPKQRKDKPVDRGAHKATPQKRTPAGQSSQDRAKDNDNKKRDTKTDNQRTAPVSKPGTASQPAPTGIVIGANNILKSLTGQRPKPPNQVAPPPPHKENRCDAAGCLVVHPAPKPPKPKPRTGIRSLDNDKVVDKAREELRAWLEGNPSTNYGPDGSTKYGRWYGPQDPTVDWCARFVSWVYAQAGFPLPDMQQDMWDKHDTGFQYVPAGEKWAQKHGMWHDGTAGIQRGDIVTFDWPNGNNESDHTGIVTDVKPDGSIETIEGNSGNKVAIGNYERDDPTINGYIRVPTNNKMPGHLKARPGAAPGRPHS